MKIRKEEWCIALRKRSDKLLFENPEDFSGFYRLTNSRRYWCADPFVWKKDGRNYLFFEMYDRLKRKGCIGYRCIGENGGVGPMKMCFEDTDHLSYPLIFEENGEIFILPESSRKKTLYLLKAVAFPDQWRIETVLLENIPLVDTTPVLYNGELCVFTTPLLEDNVSSLSICRAKDMELNADKLLSPVVVDKSKARMGGNFIHHNGELIRVSQNCTSYYGAGLVFSRVDELSEAAFKETKLEEIDGRGIVVDGKRFDGIHTYNFNEDYEVIDLKINKQFSVFEILGYIRNKILSIYSGLWRKS